nr:hypothetical protein [candidate division Zixibacteria bacterium]
MKRRTTFLSISFVLVLVLPLTLSGCGERGAAEKPPPEKVTNVVVIPVAPSLVKDQII